METMGLRLYGANDLRLERFALPEIRDDEILADVTSNGICMSDYKAVTQGAAHKRVPKDVATRPILLGHEFCGTLLEVGAKWRHKFKPGQKYSIQPAINYPGRELEAPGYSFPYAAGQAVRIIIPREVLEMDCLLPYDGEAYFYASLSETFSCIIGPSRAPIISSRGATNTRPALWRAGRWRCWREPARWGWRASTTPSTARCGPRRWW